MFGTLVIVYKLIIQLIAVRPLLIKYLGKLGEYSLHPGIIEHNRFFILYPL